MRLDHNSLLPSHVWLRKVSEESHMEIAYRGRHILRWTVLWLFSGGGKENGRARSCRGAKSNFEAAESGWIPNVRNTRCPWLCGIDMGLMPAPRDLLKRKGWCPWLTSKCRETRNIGWLASLPHWRVVLPKAHQISNVVARGVPGSTQMTSGRFDCFDCIFGHAKKFPSSSSRKQQRETSCAN